MDKKQQETKARRKKGEETEDRKNRWEEKRN